VAYRGGKRRVIFQEKAREDEDEADESSDRKLRHGAENQVPQAEEKG
jgi:hypothetical protein